MVLNVLVVALLCGVGYARWSQTQDLDSDLDSLLCHSTKYPGAIIDIHESIANGAELLDGVWAEGVASCVSGCCKTRGCDLALFKNDGVSRTGKNCYYVQCVKLGNCMMVQHDSFTTITVLQGTCIV